MSAVHDSDANAQRIEVVIFGESYALVGDADPEYVRELASYVDGKMREITTQTRNLSSARIAILAALNIANEMQQLKEQQRDLDTKIERKSATLLEILNRQLRKEPEELG